MPTEKKDTAPVVGHCPRVDHGAVCGFPVHCRCGVCPYCGGHDNPASCDAARARRSE